MDKGILYVITGPSGVGKGTVLSALRQQNPDFFLSVSATTRPPRPGEVEGVNYYFMTREEFLQTVEEGGFLEHAEFGGNLYGTPIGPIQQRLEEGLDVVLEIEVQGAMQVKELLPNCVRIFIAPPTFDVLQQRLIGRGTESEDAVRRRLDTARYELTLSPQFDYIVVNEEGQLEQAVQDVAAVMQAEHCRAFRRSFDWNTK